MFESPAEFVENNQFHLAVCRWLTRPENLGFCDSSKQWEDQMKAYVRSESVKEAGTSIGLSDPDTADFDDMDGYFQLVRLTVVVEAMLGRREKTQTVRGFHKAAERFFGQDAQFPAPEERRSMFREVLRRFGDGDMAAN